jgi:hypothetical protein
VGLFGYLKQNEPIIGKWADTASKFAQILALVLAGAWTYRTFYQSEAPELEARLDISSDVVWGAIPGGEDMCEAVVSVTVENTGKRAVDVTGMKVVGLVSDVPKKIDKPLYISAESVEHGDRFASEGDQFLSKPLIGHFPPHATRKDSFVWYFKKQPGKFAFWRFTFETKQKLPSNSGTYIWDYLCTGPQTISSPRSEGVSESAQPAEQPSSPQR